MFRDPQPPGGLQLSGCKNYSSAEPSLNNVTEYIKDLVEDVFNGDPDLILVGIEPGDILLLK